MSQKYNLNCNVNLDLPYPPIKTDSRNLEDAYAMLSNVGSSNSEMCAVSLYFYNSVILKPEYADFAECFHKISIVEMHHLDIYSSLACLVRTHSARIDVDIRIQFLCRHLQPPGFEQPSQRRCRNSLAETRYHAACNKDVFFHNPSPFYLRCAKNKSAKTKKK